MPAILAIAYASFVGSKGPVSSALSLMGCAAVFRVYAGGAKEQQPRYPRGHGSVEQVDLDLEVFGQEISGIGAVGHDAADPGRSVDDDLRS